MGALLHKPLRLRGVVAAAVTPLLGGQGPDVPALLSHCLWLLGNGCDGINLLGTTGEAMSLSVAQRLAVMEAVADSDVPVARVMVGTGASALDDATVLTHRARQLGFAGALVLPPFYYKNVADDEVFRFYVTLIERIGEPELALYLYHFPALSGVPISAALIERLVETCGATIVGIKDSSGDRGHAASLARSFPDLDVFPSAETELAGARLQGFAGCISATVNVTAPLARIAWNASRSDAAAAAEVDVALSRLRSAFAAYPLIAAVRFALGALWEDDRWLRTVPPLGSLSVSDGAALMAALGGEPLFRVIFEAVRHKDRTA